MSLYLEHFHLRELPFRITPAVSFFYRGCVRGEILAAIKYALNNGEGILTVVGEVGTGKSMLCRMLMTEVVNQVELVYIANPSLAQQEIIFHIAEELGLDVTAEHHQVTRNLQNRLLNLYAEGRRVLVCIDEAQAMPDESLEQIRLLSNLETSTDKVVQIIMFGQPELTCKLDQRHMRQLRERITSAFYLRTLNLEEVREYINHRLLAAGLAEGTKIFASAATSTVAKVSQGISRRINILCDKAMLAAFADSSPTVTANHVRKAARDARYKRMDEDGHVEELGRRRNHKTWFMTIVAAAAVLAVAYQTVNTKPELTGASARTVATGVPPTPTLEATPHQAVPVPASPSKPQARATPPTPQARAAPPTPQARAAPPTPQARATPPTPLARAAPPTPLARAAPPTPLARAAPPTPQARATPPTPPQAFTAPPATEPPVVAARNKAATPQAQSVPVPALAAQEPEPATVTALADNRKWASFPLESYLRLRLNATQSLFDLPGNTDQYTARILTVPRARAIETERYLRDLARFFTVRNVQIYPAVAESKEVFVLTYGVFPSEFQAELFIHELPSFFRNNKPYTQAMAVSRFEAGAHW